MEIKDLNKSQLILLALLLSFVTSLATGITTVTLMQQAPSFVTTPISQVVKETVEKIVPIQQQPSVNTVVIKEEDLIVNVISENKTSMFTVNKDVIDSSGKTIDQKISNGFAISNNGIVVTDATSVPNGGVYYVENSSGKFQTSLMPNSSNGLAFLKIGAPIDPTSKISYTIPKSTDITNMKAGQELVYLGDNISSSIYNGNSAIKIDATKSLGDSIVLNLNGDAVGFNFTGIGFVPMSDIANALQTALGTVSPSTSQTVPSAQ